MVDEFPSFSLYSNIWSKMILYNNAKLFGTQPSALQAHTDAMDGCKAAFHLRHIITHLSTPTTAGPASELISIMALNEASTLQSFQKARTDFQQLNVDVSTSG